MIATINASDFSSRQLPPPVAIIKRIGEVAKLGNVMLTFDPAMPLKVKGEGSKGDKVFCIDVRPLEKNKVDRPRNNGEPMLFSDYFKDNDIFVVTLFADGLNHNVAANITAVDLLSDVQRNRLAQGIGNRLLHALGSPEDMMKEFDNDGDWTDDEDIDRIPVME